MQVCLMVVFLALPSLPSCEQLGFGARFLGHTLVCKNPRCLSWNRARAMFAALGASLALAAPLLPSVSEHADMEVAQRLEGIQLTLQAHASDVKEQQEKLRQKLVILDADEHLREEYQMLLEQSYKQAAPYGG